MKDFVADEGAATIEELMRQKVHFHKPGENYKTDGYVVTPSTMELLKEHMKQTGGNVCGCLLHRPFFLHESYYCA